MVVEREVTMQPLKDIIVLEVDQPPKTTKSGLFMMEEWKTLPPFGTVTAVGPDVRDVKKGDRVVFNRYAAVVMKYQQRIITERDVLAILTGEDDA